MQNACYISWKRLRTNRKKHYNETLAVKLKANPVWNQSRIPVVERVQMHFKRKIKNFRARWHALQFRLSYVNIRSVRFASGFLLDLKRDSFEEKNTVLKQMSIALYLINLKARAVI